METMSVQADRTVEGRLNPQGNTAASFSQRILPAVDDNDDPFDSTSDLNNYEVYQEPVPSVRTQRQDSTLITGPLTPVLQERLVDGQETYEVINEETTPKISKEVLELAKGSLKADLNLQRVTHNVETAMAEARRVEAEVQAFEDEENARYFVQGLLAESKATLKAEIQVEKVINNIKKVQIETQEIEANVENTQTSTERAIEIFGETLKEEIGKTPAILVPIAQEKPEVKEQQLFIANYLREVQIEKDKTNIKEIEDQFEKLQEQLDILRVRSAKDTNINDERTNSEEGQIDETDSVAEATEEVQTAPKSWKPMKYIFGFLGLASIVAALGFSNKGGNEIKTENPRFGLGHTIAIDNASGAINSFQQDCIVDTETGDIYFKNSNGEIDVTTDFNGSIKTNTATVTCAIDNPLSQVDSLAFASKLAAANGNFEQ